MPPTDNFPSTCFVSAIRFSFALPVPIPEFPDGGEALSICYLLVFLVVTNVVVDFLGVAAQGKVRVPIFLLSESTTDRPELRENDDGLVFIERHAGNEIVRGYRGGLSK